MQNSEFCSQIDTNKGKVEYFLTIAIYFKYIIEQAKYFKIMPRDSRL